MKKIVIVVEGGRVQTVFSEEDIDVEIVDFDSDIYDFEKQEELGDYVDELRTKMKETVCWYEEVRIKPITRLVDQTL